MKNIPQVKLGLVSVSRDCFPVALSAGRRDRLAEAYGPDIYNCPVTVQNEIEMKQALEDIKAHGVNALVVYLGNFGPETAETQLAQYFDGPAMFLAAAEGDGKDLIDGRGDAYCGMLNCSYNLDLRGIRAHIPAYPIGDAHECAAKIAEFVPMARAVLGVKSLKLITFGPRPQDFLACNAPIRPLYDLGVEVEENSELDLLVAFNAHKDDDRIPEVAASMKEELGDGCQWEDILPRLAQYELTLLDWAETHKGSRQYVAFANKCWPAFQTEFGFVPCYVNSRLMAQGIPVACEVDMYGALSEYIGLCITGESVTLLDINNTVPASLHKKEIEGKFNYTLTETFMGFHCGNTPACRLKKPSLKYQLIMKRSLEPDSEPGITRGTLEGDIQEGDITFYRLQGTSDGRLVSYIAQGEILPVATGSFGGIGVFAIHEMDRFYRHVLLADHYPHHGAVAFGHVGAVLFEVLTYFGVPKISYNQPRGALYPTENPFA